MGNKQKFTTACCVRILNSDFNRTERERLKEELTELGYDTGDCFEKETENNYITIITDTDGSVRREEGYVDDIPEGVIDCKQSGYMFISLAKLKPNETRWAFFTNGWTWWLNRDDNSIFLEAAKHMGFHKASVEEIVNKFESFKNFNTLTDKFPLEVLTEMNNRSQGNTTRLVDDYVQELFKDPGVWIEVIDHYHDHTHSGDRNLYHKLRERMIREHNIEIESNRQMSRRGGICVRINPKDVNYLR